MKQINRNLKNHLKAPNLVLHNMEHHNLELHKMGFHSKGLLCRNNKFLIKNLN